MLTPDQLQQVQSFRGGVNPSVPHATPEQAKASFSTTATTNPLENTTPSAPPSLISGKQLVGDIGNTFQKGANEVTTAISNVPKNAQGAGGGLVGNALAGASAAGHISGAVAGTTGGLIGDAISQFLPDSVKNTLGKASGDVSKYITDKATQLGIPPEVQKSFGDLINVLMLEGGAKGAPLAEQGIKSTIEATAPIVEKGTQAVKDLTGKVKNVVTKTPEEISADSLQKTTDYVSPKLTANETADALAQGRGQGGGLLSKTKILPDDRTTEIGKAVQDIVNPSENGATNINNVRTALSKEADNLKTQIQSVDHPYTFKELSSAIKSVEKPAMLKSANLDKVFSQVQNKAISLAKESGGNISNLLDARKAFDAYVQKEFPNLYSSDTLTPMKSAIKNVRNAMNDFIEKNLPKDNSFKESLKKQSLYYDAIDNIASKAVPETRAGGLERGLKAIKKHPYISAGAALGADKILKSTTGIGF